MDIQLCDLETGDLFRHKDRIYVLVSRSKKRVVAARIGRIKGGKYRQFKRDVLTTYGFHPFLIVETTGCVNLH